MIADARVCVFFSRCASRSPRQKASQNSNRRFLREGFGIEGAAAALAFAKCRHDPTERAGVDYRSRGCPGARAGDPGSARRAATPTRRRGPRRRPSSRWASGQRGRRSPVTPTRPARAVEVGAANRDSWNAQCAASSASRRGDSSLAAPPPAASEPADRAGATVLAGGVRALDVPMGLRRPTTSGPWKSGRVRVAAAAWTRWRRGSPWRSCSRTRTASRGRSSPWARSSPPKPWMAARKTEPASGPRTGKRRREGRSGGRAHGLRPWSRRLKTPSRSSSQ